MGGILEVVVALACVGTAVVLYPVLKRRSPARALGFVAARTVEAGGILIGVAGLLTLLTLRRNGTGTDGAGQALIAFYDSVFIVSQGLIPAVSAVLLGSLLYQTRLVPRVLPVLGLIAAPLVAASVGGVLFGAWDRMSPVVAIAALPIAVWEFSLGVRLVVKGFSAQGQALAGHGVDGAGPPAGDAVDVEARGLGRDVVAERG
ncbi:DUF4386 domain-containing protein [Actinoplanes sp. Pm04-4]|uniref:DUF4386 domain-containing protein n=1 Tax=Paractinoplanes pyxinae TaxID=2997416 RepID=A0ABT4B0A6_9ACTN|nr:DUF4386 domain-containing protein [Actinoplanes pyxinae]MCY1139926.1 DUF4386 domain-containing protein [Actinoplanes pyxinae]